MSHGVLLDVDGTLVDSNYLHAVCWAEALAQHGVDVVTARAHALIGKGSSDLVAELGGADVDVDAVTAAHDALYAQHHGHLRVLPGARDLVRALHERGLRVVLASSASLGELGHLRATLDVDQWLDGATSSDDVADAKPEPDVLDKGRELLQTDSAVMVGDAVWDGLAAQRAGVPFVGVLTGGTGERALREAGAVEVWQDPKDLLDHLDESCLVGPGQGTGLSPRRKGTP